MIKHAMKLESKFITHSSDSRPLPFSYNIKKIYINLSYNSIVSYMVLKTIPVFITKRNILINYTKLIVHLFCYNV